MASEEKCTDLSTLSETSQSPEDSKAKFLKDLLQNWSSNLKFYVLIV